MEQKLNYERYNAVATKEASRNPLAPNLKEPNLATVYELEEPQLLKLAFSRLHCGPLTESFGHESLVLPASFHPRPAFLSFPNTQMLELRADSNAHSFSLHQKVVKQNPKVIAKLLDVGPNGVAS